MSMQVNGMDEMLKALEQMGRNIEQVKKKAIKESSEILRAEIERNANANRSTRQDRHLADSIVISDILPGADGQPYVLVGPEKGTPDQFFYGRFVELGTTKMRAKPYIEPALIAKKDAVLEDIAEHIRSELDFWR